MASLSIPWALCLSHEIRPAAQSNRLLPQGPLALTKMRLDRSRGCDRWLNGRQDAGQRLESGLVCLPSATQKAGFGQFLGGLAGHRSDRSKPLHVCMQATRNWGLDLADFMHAHGAQVSIVNPAQIKACGASECVRCKTDRLAIPMSWLVGPPRRRCPGRPVLLERRREQSEHQSSGLIYESCVNRPAAARPSRWHASRDATAKRLCLP